MTLLFEDQGNELRQRSEFGDGLFEIQGGVENLRSLRAAAQHRRYRGPTPQLPSRAKTIAIADAVVSAIYPRHFGPQGLTLPEIDAFIAETLRSALSALTDQVRLESTSASLGAGVRSAGDADLSAEEVVGAFSASLPDVRKLADGDAMVGFEGDASATSIDEVIFCFPGFAAGLRHRLAHRLHLLGAPLLARIVAEDAHARTGIDIHPGAKIGERFFIDHGTGVVIGETAVIGKNVRLQHAVTLGARRPGVGASAAVSRRDHPRHPIIEDDVTILSGATILGAVRIGRRSTIGENALVTQDVPPASLIAPAQARR